MRRISFLFAFAAVAVGLTQVPSIHAADTPTNPTSQIAERAQQFLGLLSDAQRAEALFKFDDNSQRARWSNLPVTMVKRAGLRMGDLTEEQRRAVMDLLKSTLSPMGYEKVVGIMDGDEMLKRNDSRGQSMFGRDQFYISFLGKPSATEPWMLQFGGHHLALNVTYVGPEGILTPSLIAVQPARYTLNGKTVRPLGRETDLAFELVNALDASQRKKAVLGFEMRDLVLGPGHDGETIQPEGLKAAEMTAAQKKLLIDLISEWSGIIHPKAATEKLREIQSHLDDTWFAWSGPTKPGSPAYFRVQGPTVIIEYAPQRLGGDPTQHLHTMYRDPTNDYGKKALKK